VIASVLLGGLLLTSAATAPQLLVLEPAVMKVGGDDARLLQRLLVQELADAMGAGLVVFSEVGRLGGRVIWQLGLWDQDAGRIVARATVEDTDAAGLGRHVDDVVATLLAPMAARGVRYTPRAASPLVPIGAIVTGAGALAVVGGAVGLGVGAVVVGDASYDTDLRRGFQAAGPALAVTAVGGAVVLAVGGGVWLAGALQDN
jgi:hypothetical protein